jgi:hypothetical protein
MAPTSKLSFKKQNSQLNGINDVPGVYEYLKSIFTETALVVKNDKVVLNEGFGYARKLFCPWYALGLELFN